MPRYTCVDLGVAVGDDGLRVGKQGVVDSEAEGDHDTDHGLLVWESEAYNRADLDAAWAAARAAEAKCLELNNAAPADRPRPAGPPPSVELEDEIAAQEATTIGAGDVVTLDAAGASLTAHGSEG